MAGHPPDTLMLAESSRYVCTVDYLWKTKYVTAWYVAAWLSSATVDKVAWHMHAPPWCSSAHHMYHAEANCLGLDCNSHVCRLTGTNK